MNKKLLASALAATLLVSACSSEEWESDQQRQAALREYSCQTFVEADPNLIASQTIHGMDAVTQDAGDRANAVRHSFMLQSGVMKPTCDRTSADYDDVILQTWINKTDKELGDKFTPKFAEDNGIDIDEL